MNEPRAAHANAERVLASALRDADPVAALHRAVHDGTLDPSLVPALERADPDGVRLAALLIAKLRFERLLRGSDELGRWFERDPAGFTEVFRRYHLAVAPAVFWPAEEAAVFWSWEAAQYGNPPRTTR